MDLISVGKFICEQRKIKGYSQVELANKLNISNKTVSKWERGNGFPSSKLRHKKAARSSSLLHIDKC